MSDEAQTPEVPDSPVPQPGNTPRDGEPGSAADGDPRPRIDLGKPSAPDPWAPPADTAAPAGVYRPPSLHDQWTAPSIPVAGGPDRAAGAPVPPAPHPPSQPWAFPFPPPPGGPQSMGAPVPGAPYPPPAGYGHGPVPGEPVPPPPIGPDGPGRPEYGYPHHLGPQHYPGHPGPPGQPGHGGPFAPYPGAVGHGWPGAPYGPSNGMGMASLSLGIVAAVIFCLWPLAIVLGVLAVVFGAIGRAKARRGEATNPGQALAGIICGAVGAALGVVLGILVLVLPDDLDSPENPYDDSYSTTLVLSQGPTGDGAGGTSCAG